MIFLTFPFGGCTTRHDSIINFLENEKNFDPQAVYTTDWYLIADISDKMAE